MDEAPPPPPRRRLRQFALTGLAVLFLIAALAAGGVLWLTTTEKGLSALCSLAYSASGGRLSIIPAAGTLAGPLRLQEALWRDAGLTLVAEDVSLDWSPGALLQRRLDIARLAAASLRIEPGPQQEPAALPASLRLPLAVRLGEFRIGRLERGGELLAEDLSGSFESDGLTHRLSGFQVRAGQVSVAGDAELAGDAPFGLEARVQAGSQLEGHAFSLALRAAGKLDAIEISGQSTGALQGTLALLATLFAPQPFQRLQVHLKGIDPAAWQPGAPTARLDLDAELLPRLEAAAWTVGGPFTVTNRDPGRLDAQRIPIHQLTGRADWRGDTVTFTGLNAALAGGGSLSGHGRLAGNEFTLELTANRLDASQLHPRLRPTRLTGSFVLHAGPAEQSLAADLSDPGFRLAARLERRGDEVEVRSLQLTAGEALLQARGRVSLDKAYRFAARGEMSRFDPSRFADLPAARLNTDFEAAGSLRPRPVLSLRFDIHDSRLRDQPLAGRGELELDWPAVKKAEVRLASGPNHLEAHGAFGRPGDRLDIAIDAPDLDPYGIEGGLQGQLQLSGTPSAPSVSGRLEAARLGLAGVGRVHGLELQGEGGSRAGDPLRFVLKAAAIDLPERSAAVKDISIEVRGSRSRHELRAAGALSRERHLSLAAAGGLAEKTGTLLWNGRLLELAYTAPDPDENLRLVQPATLSLGEDEWALGPAEVAGGAGWHARLLASAARGRLLAEAGGQGKRLGKVDARLEARLEGAWKLARESPWQGRLTLAGADLAWLGLLLGDDWRTAGQLHGELRLAGTPARPLVTGQVRGVGLGLAILRQGLELENGVLQADLTGDRLQVATLAFDSRLRPLPRALQRSGRDLSRLTATPGRLEVKGAIELGGAERAAGTERGFLELRLDRVGILQQPDQWIAVSGSGQLRWRGAALEAEGKLAVDAGYWKLAGQGVPKLSDDVVVRTAKEEKGRPPSTRPKLDLDVETDLGPSFYFSGHGLESRLAGSVRLKASGRDLPRATGTIRTVEGKFDAYGQKLVVERGLVNFQGFLDNPTLNVRAVRKGLSVEPGVEVTGPVQKPVVRLVSDPELPEAEKLSWLVLGHGPEQMGSNDGSTLLNAASAILGKDSSGGLTQQLQQRFGIEEFGVRRGDVSDPWGHQATSRVAGSGSFSGTTPGTTDSQIVTVSKRLAANMLLSYEQAVGRTENIVKLTVNLSRKLSVVGRAGSDNAVDLFYTFSFGK